MKRFHGFLEDERGSATMEFVLWVPIFVTILMILVDAAFVYLTYSNMINATRDAARRASIGLIDGGTDSERQQALETFRAATHPGYAMTITRSGNEITVVTEEAFEDVLAFSIFGTFVGDTLKTQVTMRVEPGV